MSIWNNENCAQVQKGWKAMERQMEDGEVEWQVKVAGRGEFVDNRHCTAAYGWSQPT